MKSNPCLKCPTGDKDKNNKTCMHCDKRIQYVCELDQALDFSRCNTAADHSQPYRSSCTRISRMLTAAGGLN